MPTQRSPPRSRRPTADPSPSRVRYGARSAGATVLVTEDYRLRRPSRLRAGGAHLVRLPTRRARAADREPRGCDSTRPAAYRATVEQLSSRCEHDVCRARQRRDGACPTARRPRARANGTRSDCAEREGQSRQHTALLLRAGRASRLDQGMPMRCRRRQTRLLRPTGSPHALPGHRSGRRRKRKDLCTIARGAKSSANRCAARRRMPSRCRSATAAP